MSKMVISLSILLLICANGFSQDKKVGEGYSIFKGTMVDLTWPDVKKLADENAIVLIPTGVIEEHGPHLGIGTDTYIASLACQELKTRIEKLGQKVAVTPPMYWGIMQLNETGAFPGSFTVEPSTMKALLMDLFADLNRWGFHRIYCVDFHGDRIHRKTLGEAMNEAKKTLGISFYNDQEGMDERNEPDLRKYVKGDLFQPDYHAGAFEVALMLAYFPNEVRTAVADTLKPESTFQPLGYVGDPANHNSFEIRSIANARADFAAENIVRWMKGFDKKPVE